MQEDTLNHYLSRIASALERLAPQSPEKPDFTREKTHIWHASTKSFHPLKTVPSIKLNMLIGLESQKQQLLTNTKSFAEGYPANNALLWGARGMGKSSLIKAIHQHVLDNTPTLPLILIEIHREDISSLDECLNQLGDQPQRFILFCDDLSFEQTDDRYKSLKTVLEGGLSERPTNTLFYATSNQRHLMIASASSTAKAAHETDHRNETISLSDRFGLWLGFHNCSPEEFQTMVRTYSQHFQIPLSDDELQAKAHEWAMTRGNRSGRVAWQFIQHLCAEFKIKHERT